MRNNIQIKKNYWLSKDSLPLEEMLAIAKRAKRCFEGCNSAGFYPRVEDSEKPLYQNGGIETGDIIITLSLIERRILPDKYQVLAEVATFEDRPRIIPVGRVKTCDRRVAELFRYAQEQSHEESVYRAGVARAGVIAKKEGGRA